MRRSISIPALVCALSAACFPAVPADPAPAREPTRVAAPFARTWDAVIDQFAARNIPIGTIDRASGLIAVTTPHTVPSRESPKWADCGSFVGLPLPAETATYNVLVRGDSAASTVRVTAVWEPTKESATCVTKGVWEGEFETTIKQLAER